MTPLIYHDPFSHDIALIVLDVLFQLFIYLFMYVYIFLTVQKTDMPV